MKVVFMGTPDFAVGTLEEVIRAGHEVVLVVTQPDKPKGRGKELQFPPVKQCAIAHGIEVFQPGRVKEDKNVEYIKKYKPDIMVVAAFGQILPQGLLDLPKYGCINVHASLLPKYRGAAPIQWAILNGEAVTGVTIQRMDMGIDTGDIISMCEVGIDEEETGGSLFDKLADAGAKLCIETMERLEKGTAEFVPQNHEAATHTSMITKELGDMDWTHPAVELERLVRGLTPWPGAYTHLGNKMLKVWKTKVLDEQSEKAPGTVVRTEKDGLVVQTGDKCLKLLEVQLEGKKRMDAGAFLRGCPVAAGTAFIRE